MVRNTTSDTCLTTQPDVPIARSVVPPAATCGDGANEGHFPRFRTLYSQIKWGSFESALALRPFMMVSCNLPRIAWEQQPFLVACWKLVLMGTFRQSACNVFTDSRMHMIRGAPDAFHCAM